MPKITVILDNSLNSPETNPPGFNQWVGGQERGDLIGIKVDKTDTDLNYTMDSSIPFLQTWYFDYEWYSGANIDGPFVDGQKISLIKINK